MGTDPPPESADTFVPGSSAASNPPAPDGANAGPASPGQLDSTFIPATGIAPDVVIAGRYILRKQLGEGGMGEVWMATQTEPVRRNVALKLIKAGMDSKAILVRFEQERQALALMNHPNIARVFDAGVTPAGHPFFAMELVEGLPLTQFSDQNRLSSRARLELFIPICQAIKHAHQKGIVHRDLKPANILVTLVDGQPVPKVIDFGVAKATSGKLTADTLSTGFGAVVGTLEYMSPEQAGTSGVDIDTRADIYSLGVVLYELLTGLRPFDSARLRQAALSEMIRVIREDDPSRPSTRLSTDALLPSAAALRQTEPKRLLASLRGELDWVVMKCLEKSRDRRYETADGLARDIQRYLHNEPVEARPATTGYRLRKLVARHQGKVVAGVLLLMLLIAGTVGTTLGLFEARRQAEIARKETAAAEQARLAESLQRDAAEQANQQAVAALESFTSSFMRKVLGSRSQLSPEEISILNDASRQWEVLAAAQGTSPRARRLRATGASNLATIQYKLGQIEEAEANDRKALQLWQSLVDESANNIDDQRQLAISHQGLGATLRSSGKRAESGVHFRSAVQIFATLLDQNPESPDLQDRLADSHISLANAERDAGRWPDAQQNYLDAQRLQLALADRFPQRAEFQENVARSHWGLAALNKRMNQPAEAAGHYQQAIAVYQRLLEQFPLSLEYQQAAGNLYRELGVLLSDHGDDAAGAEQLARALDRLEVIATKFPSIPDHQFELAKARRDAAQVHGYLNQPDRALALFDQSIAILRKLAADHPTSLSYLSELGITWRMLADLKVRQSEPAAALDTFNQAIETLTTAFVQDPSYSAVRNSLRKSYEGRAKVKNQLHRHAEANGDWEKALEFCRPELLDDMRIQRVISQIQTGAASASIDELLALSALDKPDPELFYLFAELFVTVAEAKLDRPEDFLQLAVNMLQQAVALGLSNTHRLDQDPTFQSLRDRADFQALLPAKP